MWILAEDACCFTNFSNIKYDFIFEMRVSKLVRVLNFSS